MALKCYIYLKNSLILNSAASKILLRKAFEFNGKQLTACFKTDKRKVLMKHVPVEAHYQDILDFLEQMSGRKTKEFNVKYSEYPGTYLVEFCEETGNTNSMISKSSLIIIPSMLLS